MSVEVELKFALSDPAAFRHALESLEARRADTGIETRESDEYFAHPVREFAKTDEALRIRSTNDGTVLTYKGPRLDTTTKTRKELETAIVAGDANAALFRETLLALGFVPVAVVRKLRETWSVHWESRSVTITIDTVDDVGIFCELECVIDGHNQDWSTVRDSLVRLAEHLPTGSSERSSYLELLLNTRQ